ncbi:MAG: hypothetical protein M1819_002561 [Sarea resinae]|nr:MAG: hypothetical protein M1819_002561 [Sarea resinae]
MAQRPDFIDIRSTSFQSSRKGMNSPQHLSPRIQHAEGDVPPALSPLDAFAAHSRLMAKQLEESRRNGRRMSRLPPLDAEAFAAARPGYFRSRSVDTDGNYSVQQAPKKDEEPSGNSPEVEDPKMRPKSYYTRLSEISSRDGDSEFGLPSPIDEVEQVSSYEDKQTQRSKAIGSRGRLGPRVDSPEPMGTTFKSASVQDLTSDLRLQKSLDSGNRFETLQSGYRNDPYGPRSHPLSGLAPPRSPHVRQAASIRSVPADSDDDLSGSMGTSFDSRTRKLSSSSGMSRPQSPQSPWMAPPRSPSISSEYSIGGGRGPRSALNFSRPLSRASRPSFDIPSRQASSESQPYVFTDDTAHTPVSMNSEEYFEPSDQSYGPAPSYIYAKYSLPRGRLLQRGSVVYAENDSPQFKWEQPNAASHILSGETFPDLRPPSPASPPRPSTASDRPRPRTPDNKTIRQKRSSAETPTTKPLSGPVRQSYTPSVDSNSTIKAPSNRSLATSANLSAEDHLAKGIACHERGSLNESTYHLRIAAKQDNPTAMLLYALACRHGWGMRPNQKEGVQWLRKASDFASLEVALDEDEANQDKPTDVNEKKTRRAQFALSIYELGVSHLNGWGIEQDKSLALRCFEIAGNWGDADAMAEAGFCYAQGVGCKKDLKKAAKFYRMAESKGMSMVGNSW